MRLIVVCPLLALLTTVPAAAQHDHGGHGSPYAGQQDRAIKALAPEEAEGLAAGAGLGYAKAAELNGWPGPLHVLELRDELGLEPDQVVAVERVYRSMHAEAVELGEAILREEAELQALLLEPTPPADRVRERTVAIAELEGRLRAVHLVAHLRTRPLLTQAQVERYITLRGYREEG